MYQYIINIFTKNQARIEFQDFTSAFLEISENLTSLNGSKCIELSFHQLTGKFTVTM